MKRLVPVACSAFVVLAACSSGHARRVTSATVTTTTTIAGGTTAATGSTTTTASTSTSARAHATTTTTAGTTGSGVRGTVLAGPTCPVQRVDNPCPDKPVVADVRVVRPDGSVAAATRSGSDGRFSVGVAPGHYTVQATSSSAFAGCRPVDVTVPQGAYATADVSCDTGMR